LSWAARLYTGKHKSFSYIRKDVTKSRLFINNCGTILKTFRLTSNKQLHYAYNSTGNHVLDSERSDEYIGFTTMCAFQFFNFVYGHFSVWKEYPDGLEIRYVPIINCIYIDNLFDMFFDFPNCFLLKVTIL